MSTLRALIVAGDGINCESETAEAFRLAGFQAETVSINHLIKARFDTDQLSAQYSALAFPGGFSFGDYLSSGRILAIKIARGLRWNLPLFAERGGLVLGVCNGFQALVRLGVFGRFVSLTSNVSGKFVNHWTSLSPQVSRCLWLKGLGTFSLPVRHGEGRLVLDRSNMSESLEKLTRHGMACLKYQANPNGSDQDLAGLCDATGRIFGLMPHPEAFVRWTSHPGWTKQASRAGGPGEGLLIFENAAKVAKQVGG